MRKQSESSKEGRWRRHVEGWQKSGRSQRNYCEDHGLAVSTFQLWRRRLAADAPCVELVQVSRAIRLEPASLTLLLAEGRYRLEISGSSRTEILRDVLDVLEGPVVVGPDQIQVYVAVGNVDMRKSIDGLSILVSQRFALDPFAGHMFAFSNRRRTMVKVLYWDRNGFCLWQKRLERERFRWPESREDVLRIDHREFRWLLDGLELHQRQAHRRLQYSAVC